MLTVVSSKGNSLAPGQGTSQDRVEMLIGSECGEPNEVNATVQ